MAPWPTGLRSSGTSRTPPPSSGIDKHIQFNSRVSRAAFDTSSSTWTLTLDDRTVTCNFPYSCAGYYSYDEGYLPDFPGIDDFEGTVVITQFWPDGLDYTGKRWL